MSLLFDSNSTSEIRLVGGLKESSSSSPSYSDKVYRTIYLNPGDLLFSGDRTERGLYFVQSGCLKVFLSTSALRGRRHTGDFLTRLVSSGEYLGRPQMPESERGECEVVAAKPSVVCFYTPEAVSKMLELSDPVIRAVLKQALDGRRLLEADQQSLYLASVRERVANQLVVLADRFGVKVVEGVSLNLKLSRYEFGQLAGTVNESFSRYLSEFKEQGLVDIRGKEIIIKDRAGLLSCAGVEGEA